MILDVIRDIGDLFIGHKGPLHPGRLGVPLWVKQHISLAEQLLRPIHIQNRSGIHTARYGEGDPARHIGLDQSCDHIHGRALGRDDQVDSCHHQIRKLVYNDDNLRKRSHGVAMRIPCFFIIPLQIADGLLREPAVPVRHLRNSPLQGAGRFLGIRHHRKQQMRDSVIDRELHNFGIDHDELDLIRSITVKNTQNNRIDTDGFAGTGGTRDQKMRHLGYIRHHDIAADIFSDTESDFAVKILIFL